MTEHLSRAVKISTAITPTEGAAAQTNITGTILDMLNYDAVMIVVRFGTIAPTAVTTIKAQRDSAAAMGTAEDIAGSEQTVAATDDDKIFVIDIYRPSKRYVRLVVTRGTADATVADAIYYQYSAHLKPVSQSLGGIERFVDAIGGTA